MTSDVDLVILTEDPAGYEEDEAWWGFLGSAELVRTQRWGPLTERRVRLSSGLEVEFGITGPAWANTHPLDPGTAAVIGEGARIVFDPDQRLRRLLQAVARPPRP